MKIEIFENYEQMSRAAAETIARTVQAAPFPVLGLATGSTPLGAYRNLIEMCGAGVLSFKNVRTVNLDEYVGLGEESAQSYAAFMEKNLFSHIDIDRENTNLPDGKAEDPQAECERYSQLLKGMPRDLQLLGLGSDGHIGFNEPYTPFGSRTHIAELAESTIRDNSRLFGDISEVPRRAITMGIADITEAKKILLLACGANKARAVYDMVKGGIDEKCPASILQKHPDAVIMIDREAAQLL